jgi:hypothetical protein
MTREEQDRRIDKLMEWTPGEMALHITVLEDALRRISNYPSVVPSEFFYQENPNAERHPDFRQIAREALQRCKRV